MATQNTQTGVPLRPIISSRGSATYETAKELANIIKPLVGRSPHHVQNNKDFLENIKVIKLQPDECIMSYDVSALFTSIPIDPAIKTIKKHLEEDQDLSKRTSMTVDHTISLLEFCLRNTYFSFQGRYYEQTEGAAMGSPISHWLQTYLWRNLKIRPSALLQHHQSYGRDLLMTLITIIKKNNKDSFLEHLNSINPKIQFTCEEIREDGSIPFLDILVTPEDDGSLKTSVFRKTTHTDLYLQWDSHHTFNLSTVWLVPYFIEHPLCAPLPNCCKKKKNTFPELSQDVNTPTWAIKRARMRSQNSNNIRTRRTNQTGQKNKTNLYMVVPYHQGLSERIKRSCNKFGVQVFFKGGQTIRNLLMAPKDKDPITNKSGVIYRYKCSQHGCKEEYIGESARNFAERFKNIRRPLPLYLTTVTSQVTTSTSTILL